MAHFRHIRPPPRFFIREFLEEGLDVDENTTFEQRVKEYFDLERYRWGLQTDYLDELYIGIGTAAACCCTCFRWVWTTVATTNGQTDFIPTLPYMTLEDNEYQLVVARSSHQYYGVDYTINVATNTITLIPGLLLGEPLTIYALRNNDLQEVFYEIVAVPAMPYAFTPPVTLDRAGGRQLVFARTSPRFLDSGRPGDEYEVSPVNNTLSLTAGLGPIGAMAALYRLTECGVRFHSEVLATVAGQTIFTPDTLDNFVRPHDIGKMMVFQRTSFLHPSVDFTTDVLSNTITINAPGLNVGQPLNVWVFR